MERTIRIANTKTQQRYTIQTNANTLGELQDQMTAQGIDFSGMSFTEGLSKTQLLTRDSMLPTNVMYKGQPTNDLVMLLTNTTKNIASGAIDRKEAYRLIKEMNLQDAITEGEGQNYTRCKTDVLESYITIAQGTVPYTPDSTPSTHNAHNAHPAHTSQPLPDISSAPHAETIEWLYTGIKAMLKECSLYTEDVAVLASLLTELYKRAKESETAISDEDIDNMIANL